MRLLCPGEDDAATGAASLPGCGMGDTPGPQPLAGEMSKKERASRKPLGLAVICFAAKLTNTALKESKGFPVSICLASRIRS